MKDEWFVITDMEQFTNKLRTIVFTNFGEWKQDTDSMVESLRLSITDEEQKELDSTLSYSESLLIVQGCVKKQKNKKTLKVRYLLNDSLFAKAIDALNHRMVSNILNSLTQKGYIESGYDSSINDFVFWIKDENKKDQENPETD